MDLNNLVDKAKDLAENVPGDIKEKASDFVDVQVDNFAPENVKGQAKDLVEGLKDKLGL